MKFTIGLAIIAFVALALAGCVQQSSSPTPTQVQITATATATPASTALPTTTPTIQPTGQATSTPSPSATQGAVKEFTMTAKQWSFEPSEIRVSKGDIVKLKIKSVDVEHGFKLPDFGVDANLQPGQEVTVEFTADKAGTFTFSCNVFCGSGHSEMEGTLIVDE